MFDKSGFIELFSTKKSRQIHIYWSLGLSFSLGKVTKSDQIWGITKYRLCKVIENQQVTKSVCASGGSTFICLLSIYYKISKLKRKLLFAVILSKFKAGFG